MALTEIEFLSGIFSIISIIIFTTLGFIILSKYFKYKQRTFLLFGITVAGIIQPYYGPAFSFLSALFTGQGLSAELYFFISLFAVPFITLIFVTFVTDLLYKSKQKIIQLIFLFYAIIFEIYLIYFLIYNPNVIGVLVGTTDAEYKLITAIYIGSLLLTLFIGGILIVRQSLRSDKSDLKLKGKILLLAFCFYVFSAIVDTAVPLNTLTLPLNRIILILSGVLFYMGFMLPNWAKRLFIKKNQISIEE